MVKYRHSGEGGNLGDGEVPPLRFAKGDALSVAKRRGMQGEVEGSSGI